MLCLTRTSNDVSSKIEHGSDGDVLITILRVVLKNQSGAVVHPGQQRRKDYWIQLARHLPGLWLRLGLPNQCGILRVGLRVSG